MKILFVPKEFPHGKVIGGPILIYNRIKYLSKNHFVGMASFIKEDDRQYLDTLKPYLYEIELMPYPLKHNFIKKSWDFFFSNIPYYLCPYKSTRMRQLIGKMTYKTGYDVVISEYSMVAQYLYKNPHLNPRTKRVMSCHECYTIARKKVRDFYGPFSREGLKAIFQLYRLEKYEFSMYRSADKVLVLTPQEKEGMLSYAPDLDIEVVPHGTDTDFFTPVKEKSNESALAFLGNYPHDPNRDAVMHFIIDMWPSIKQAIPQVKFYVIGRGPTQDILDKAKEDPDIIVTGQVDDVRDYLKMANVFVAPIRLGKGFRGKILEAMSMAIPVVTTSLGAEGISTVDMENIAIADDINIFIQKTIKLLKEAELARKIGDNGRDLIVNNYSYQKGAKILEDVLNKVVEGI
jgi:glycosyltransferase involved in cell wall biosynthesis